MHCSCVQPHGPFLKVALLEEHTLPETTRHAVPTVRTNRVRQLESNTTCCTPVL
jgi:hypothetical protein